MPNGPPFLVPAPHCCPRVLHVVGPHTNDCAHDDDEGVIRFCSPWAQHDAWHWQLTNPRTLATRRRRAAPSTCGRSLTPSCSRSQHAGSYAPGTAPMTAAANHPAAALRSPPAAVMTTQRNNRAIAKGARTNSWRRIDRRRIRNSPSSSTQLVAASLVRTVAPAPHTPPPIGLALRPLALATRSSCGALREQALEVRGQTTSSRVISG
jgi:hypothetical protein